MDLSYREKSIWGSLAVTVAVYGAYFATVLGFAHTFTGGSLARLISAIVVLVIVQIVTQIVIAISEGDGTRPDERDVLIASKAYRNGYVVLAAGVFMLMMMVIVFQMTAFMIVNLMLFCMVLSEVFKSATQLFYYQRGV